MRVWIDADSECVNAMEQYKIIERKSSRKAGNIKNISAGEIAFFRNIR